MFIKKSVNQMSTPRASSPKRHTRKPRFVALALAASTLVTGLGLTTMGAQAAGLSDLFDNNASKSKFLPVDQAFGVDSSSKTTAQGTRVSISFDITPGHYVYKDRLTLSFPKGVSATPFKFNQTPVSVNDPTFGRVPVFTQKSVVATTTLTANNGKTLKNAPITIGWQGCSKAGLCYPPEKINTTVNIAPAKK